MTRKIYGISLKKLFRKHHEKQTYYIMNARGAIFSENLSKRQGLLTLEKLKIQFPKERFYLEMELPIF